MEIGSSHANKYDKVFKENIEYTLPGIVKHILELDIVHSEEMSHDLQYTKERKPDVLRKVTDQDNRTYILHVELQSRNEKDMVFRMVEYRVMLQRKYRLPVKQYVLYIGRGRLTMRTNIDEENFKFRYGIVTLKQLDYKIFLQSDLPEEKILAILGNFGEDNPKEIAQAIVTGVKQTADGELAQSRYLNQLKVLAQLRKLDIKTENMTYEDKVRFYESELAWRRLAAKILVEIFVPRLKERGFDPDVIADLCQEAIQNVAAMTDDE
jgi:predicted transposase/invertase (TIGR01784 family)